MVRVATNLKHSARHIPWIFTLNFIDSQACGVEGRHTHMSGMGSNKCWELVTAVRRGKRNSHWRNLRSSSRGNGV